MIDVSPTIATLLATQWQGGTAYWTKVGNEWQAGTTHRGGWQGFRSMQFGFAAGLRRALVRTPQLACAQPRGDIVPLSYQDDTYLLARRGTCYTPSRRYRPR